MDLVTYQQNTQRTCPSLGSKELDHAHMIFGMISELRELDHAIIDQDQVNIGEEITDIAWYHSNYCRINNISYNNIERQLWGIVVHEDHFKELSMCLSDLCNKEKRELAYKKTFDELEKRVLLARIFNLLKFLYKQYDLDIEKCMQNNIDKLKARYPDKFTEENALNRNLDLERKELEK